MTFSRRSLGAAAVVLVAVVAAVVSLLLRSPGHDVLGARVVVALGEAGVLSSDTRINTFYETTREGTALLEEVNRDLEGVHVTHLERDVDRVTVHSQFSSSRPLTESWQLVGGDYVSCFVTTVTPSDVSHTPGWIDIPNGGICSTETSPS